MSGTQSSWHDTLEVGIIAYTLVHPELLKDERQILNVYKMIAEDPFFGAIEIILMKDEQLRKELAHLLSYAHMDVIYAGGPTIYAEKYNLNHLTEDERIRSVNGVKGLIDDAYLYNARLLVVESGPDPAEEERPRAYRQLVKSMNELCQYAREKAADYEMTLSLECFDRMLYKKAFIGPTQEAVLVAEEVKEVHENFGLSLDLGHLPLQEEDFRESLLMAKDHLTQAHLGNCVKDLENPLFGDRHPFFGIPGGENDVEEVRLFLRILKEIGFMDKETATRLPEVSFEVKILPGQEPKVVLANIKRVFLEAWDGI